MPHYGLFLWALICKLSAIFSVCESLSALTVCVSNSKLYACISLNIHLLLWWMRDGWSQYIWSGRIEILYISMVYSSLQERGGVSRAHKHLKQHGLEQRAENSWFWQGKGVFLHYHWEILTKVCYGLFIKTLKNHINLCKMGIWWWPL